MANDLVVYNSLATTECGIIIGSKNLKIESKEKEVARTGIEPATQGFSVLCSTD